MSRIHQALRTILLEDPAEIEALRPEEKYRVASLLEANRLEPFVYYRLQEEKAESRVSEELLAVWKLAHLLAVSRTLAYAEALEEILDLAAREKIPVRLLRGTQLAFFAYPKPEARPLDDLELQAPPDSAADLHEAAKSLRFLEIEDLSLDPEEDPEALPQLAREGVTLRIFRRSLRKEASAPWDPFSNEPRAQAAPRILRPEPLVILLAEDAARRSFCHSLRTLVDLHVVAESLVPCWEQVAELAAQTDLALETYLALALVEGILGLAVDRECLHELREKSGCPEEAVRLLEKLSRLAVSLYPAPARLARFVERVMRSARRPAPQSPGSGWE